MTTPPRGLGRGLGALIPSSGASAADAALDSVASGVLEVSVTDIIPNPRQPRTVIPRSVRLSEAPSYGQTILTYAPQSAGALAYRALAQELMAREAQLEARS